MQSHAYADHSACRPGILSQGVLRSGGGGKRIAGACKDDEERIALRIHLAAAVRLHRGTQDPSVLSKHLSILWAQLLQQPSGAFYIGEEKGDRAGG
jgi:hypothetical protein